VCWTFSRHTNKYGTLTGNYVECAVKAFARKYNLKESIPVEDLLYLAKELMEQGDGTVEKVSNAHKRKDLDIL
jgi:hypothetical protein